MTVTERDSAKIYDQHKKANIVVIDSAEQHKFFRESYKGFDKEQTIALWETDLETLLNMWDRDEVWKYKMHGKYYDAFSHQFGRLRNVVTDKIAQCEEIVSSTLTATKQSKAMGDKSIFRMLDAFDGKLDLARRCQELALSGIEDREYVDETDLNANMRLDIAQLFEWSLGFLLRDPLVDYWKARDSNEDVHSGWTD